MLDIARETARISRQGLAARAVKNASGADETKYLEFVEEVVRTGRSPADDLIASFNGDWHGEIDRAFTDAAF